MVALDGHRVSLPHSISMCRICVLKITQRKRRRIPRISLGIRVRYPRDSWSWQAIAPKSSGHSTHISPTSTAIEQLLRYP